MDSKVKKEHTLNQLEYHLFEKQLKATKPEDFNTEREDLDKLGKIDQKDSPGGFTESAIKTSFDTKTTEINTEEIDKTEDISKTQAVNEELAGLSNKLTNMAVKIKDEFFLLAQTLTNKVLQETEALFEAVKDDPVGRAGLEVQAYSQQGQKIDKDTQNSIVQRTIAHQKAASKNADIMFTGIQIASRDLGAKGYGYIGEGSAYMSQFKEWVQKGFSPTDNASERAEMEYYIKGLQGR